MRDTRAGCYEIPTIYISLTLKRRQERASDIWRELEPAAPVGVDRSLATEHPGWREAALGDQRRADLEVVGVAKGCARDRRGSTRRSSQLELAGDALESLPSP